MIAVLLFATMLCDTAHLLAPRWTRRPLLTLLRRRRAALEAEERWSTDLLLHGRIDGHSYQQRMSGLARGRHLTRPRWRRRSSHDFY
ncbi:hypothetical protein [Streptomyces sp. WAC00263]|uniref:hypothetical protein n=1 Tax=Streptomyces sp. WAC00263 TaxID=1917422 RepID=UPI001F50E8A9|nr:hypothetical protein [Streptomyces sp. WAC00263]